MLVKILSCTPKPFKGTDGKEVQYFWCDAVTADNIQIQVGSKVQLTPGQEVEVLRGYDRLGRITFKVR